MTGWNLEISNQLRTCIFYVLKMVIFQAVMLVFGGVHIYKESLKLIDFHFGGDFGTGATNKGH